MAVALPFQGAHLQPGVRSDPGLIDLDSLGEQLHGIAELGLLGDGAHLLPLTRFKRKVSQLELAPVQEKDPVEGRKGGEELVDRFRTQVMDDDREDALVVLLGMRDFQLADLGGHRGLADDKQESIRLLDGGIDFLQPVLSWWDVLAVDPGGKLALFKALVDQPGKSDVFARIGDKDVCHVLSQQQLLG